MHLLVDADSLCYGAGFVCNEPDQEHLACWQLDKSIETLLTDVSPATYQLYLTGSDNFRYKVYPEYKANRTETKRPIHLEALKAHMMEAWGATLTHAIEADDAVGIGQCIGDDESCIAHIDKDIDMIVGRHYNFRKKEFYDISQQEADFNFFKQIIMGDRVDNIPGYDGKMRNVVPKFLQSTIDELFELRWSPDDMFKFVADFCHHTPEELCAYAHALWIQREEDSVFHNFLGKNTMEATGLQDVSTALLHPHSEPEADDGLPSTSA